VQLPSHGAAVSWYRLTSLIEADAGEVVGGEELDGVRLAVRSGVEVDGLDGLADDGPLDGEKRQTLRMVCGSPPAGWPRAAATCRFTSFSGVPCRIVRLTSALALRASFSRKISMLLEMSRRATVSELIPNRSALRTMQTR